MTDTNIVLTRHIVVKIILNEKTYPATDGSNVKIIRAESNNDSLLVQAVINKVAGWQSSEATITIHGMLMDDINALIKVNNYEQDQYKFVSKIEIYAGYEVDSKGMPPLVYIGDIYTSAVDLNNPNRSRPVTIRSQKGWENAGIVIAPTVVADKSISLKSLFETLAKNFNGYSAVITGADNKQVDHIQYQGTALQQIQSACADYGFQFKQDDTTLLISPIGVPYIEQIVTISSQDILLGYPTPGNFWCSIRVRFNPAIRFGMRINLITSLEGYEGIWWINGMSHNLTNRGREFSTVLQLNRYSQTQGATNNG